MICKNPLTKESLAHTTKQNKRCYNFDVFELDQKHLEFSIIQNAPKSGTLPLSPFPCSRGKASLKSNTSKRRKEYALKTWLDPPSDRPSKSHV